MNLLKPKLVLAVLSALVVLSSNAHDKVKLEFVANQGQWHENALYKVSYGGGAIFLEDGCFTYSFFHPEDRATVHDFTQWSREEQLAFELRGHAWKMHFEGANQAVLSGEDKQSHYYNYFIGNDESKWASRVDIFTAVTYDNLYDGIDLRAYNRGANFKYDFMVDPGADPSQIILDLEGLENLEIVNGELVLHTSVGAISEAKPYCYQLINGTIQDVECNYILEGTKVSFEFPSGFDQNYRLIIDPELIAATLSGTSGVSNYGHTATFDLAGNIYTGCISFGAGYPTTTGAFQENFAGGGWGTDIAVSKLNADGSDLIWASYLGGGEGDYPHSLIVNSLQEVYVYGSSTASDFPTSAGAYDGTHNGASDIVISHFNADGTDLIGSTYIGGDADDGRNAYSVNYGDTYRGEIILDNQEKPLIASFSQSDDFPTTAFAYQDELAGAQDAVVFRLNPSLTNLEMSTYLGSTENDSGYGVRVNAEGSVFVAGMAGAGNFPVTAGVYQDDFLGGGDDWLGEADGFVSVLNSTATTLLRSTFFGTVDQDQVFFIDLDNDENVYIYGQAGVDVPITDNVFSVPNSRQFITKLDAELTEVLVSTQIGTGTESGTDFVPIAFLVDHCNNIYISAHNAYGWNGDLPLTADALYSGDNEAFYLAVFTEDLEELEFGTKYTSNHVDGGTSRFDKNGTVYQAVCSGGDFATTADAWATDQTGGWDIGVFKIDFDVSGVNSAISGSDVNGCAPFEVEFSNYSVGDIFFWDFGDGTTSTEFEPSHTYEDPGLYTVSLISSDSLSCNLADTSFIEISISVPQDFFPDFDWQTNCEAMSITTENLTGIDWLDYEWDMGDGTILQGEDVEYFYEEPGTYTVTLTAVDNGCDADEAVSYDVTIYDEVFALIGNDDLEGCAPFEIEFDNASAGVNFIWDFGDGSPQEVGNEVTHIYDEPGEYTVTLIAEGSADCSGADTATSTVVVIPPPDIVPAFEALQINDCEETTVQLDNTTTGDGVSDWNWDFGDGTFSGQENPPDHIYDVPGNYTITLIIVDEVCDQEWSFQEEISVIDALDLQLAPDVAICYYDEGITIQAATFPGETTYEWSTGETTSSIYVTEPGQYSVVATSNNCSGVDYVEVTEVGTMYEVYNMVACAGTQTMIEIPYFGSSYYQWCTGEIAQEISADEPGDYCFQFIDESGCVQEGVIHLEHIDNEATLYIPNAFTPNNDGVNDVFQPVGEGVTGYELGVWNRWGDEVYFSDEPGSFWNGSYQDGSHFVPDGVYIFQVQYNNDCSAEKVVRVGTVTVIR